MGRSCSGGPSPTALFRRLRRPHLAAGEEGDRREEDERICRSRRQSGGRAKAGGGRAEADGGRTKASARGGCRVGGEGEKP
jgi:hypothetical protein